MQLNVSVLVKHTWAGHGISMVDLITVFGAPCAKIVGKKVLNELLTWLTANRRSDASFKMSNQTHTDLGTLFWMYALNVGYFCVLSLYSFSAMIK